MGKFVILHKHVCFRRSLEASQRGEMLLMNTNNIGFRAGRRKIYNSYHSCLVLCLWF